jgi:hypothetical protein
MATLIRGEVSNLVISRGQKMNPFVDIYEQIWSFDVSTEPSADSPISVTIEMRGYKFKGDLTEGDRVELSIDRKAKQPYRIKSLKNLSLGITFEAQK